jgi:hypothetical protein
MEAAKAAAYGTYEEFVYFIQSEQLEIDPISAAFEDILPFSYKDATIRLNIA